MKEVFTTSMLVRSLVEREKVANPYAMAPYAGVLAPGVNPYGGAAGNPGAALGRGGSVSMGDLGKDFVAGMDPFGTYTGRYGQEAEQRGLSDGQHALRQGVGTVGGLVGGGLVVPSAITGVMGAAQGYGKGKTTGERITNALAGGYEGVKKPIKSLIDARRASSYVNRAAANTGLALAATKEEAAAIKNLAGEVNVGAVLDQFGKSRANGGGGILGVARGLLGMARPGDLQSFRQQVKDSRGAQQSALSAVQNTGGLIGALRQAGQRLGSTDLQQAVHGADDAVAAAQRAIKAAPSGHSAAKAKSDLHKALQAQRDANAALNAARQAPNPTRGQQAAAILKDPLKPLDAGLDRLDAAQGYFNQAATHVENIGSGIQGFLDRGRSAIGQGAVAGELMRGGVSLTPEMARALKDPLNKGIQGGLAGLGLGGAVGGLGAYVQYGKGRQAEQEYQQREQMARQLERYRTQAPVEAPQASSYGYGYPQQTQDPYGFMSKLQSADIGPFARELLSITRDKQKRQGAGHV